MTDDSVVLNSIRRLVDEEHAVRAQRARLVGDPEMLRHRAEELESELDQCWDLLRQRRARRAIGEDPESAVGRPGDRVESYLQ
jgi:Protein of unknown function (DUF2630)